MFTQCNRKILVRILFGIYCLLLVYIISFKCAFPHNLHFDIDLNRLNLVPFYYDGIYIGLRPIIQEILLNILAFVPFGIFLKILNIGNKKIVLLGFLASLMLELSQLLFGLGNSDTTDLTTNTLGVLLGIVIYILFEKIFKRKTNNILTILSIIGIVVLFLYTLY